MKMADGKDKRINQLEEALRYAIDEADEWCFDSRFDIIDTPEMNEAKKLIGHKSKVEVWLKKPEEEVKEVSEHEGMTGIRLLNSL